MDYRKHRSLISGWLIFLAIPAVVGVCSGSSALAQDSLDRSSDLFSQSRDTGVPIATISKDALKSKLDRNERIVLLASADSGKFKDCHLPGAINLQLRDARKKARKKIRDRQAQVVVYAQGAADEDCERLARDLVAQGYTDVRIYSGGVSDWLSSGYPTEGRQKSH